MGPTLACVEFCCGSHVLNAVVGQWRARRSSAVGGSEAEAVLFFETS